eukprot:11813533-Alexandrium_andersonii.AAC.1
MLPGQAQVRTGHQSAPGAARPPWSTAKSASRRRAGNKARCRRARRMRPTGQQSAPNQRRFQP